MTSMTSSNGHVAKPRLRSLRCAIYARKSNEDRLQQEFTSLDAQGPACRVRHRSWVAALACRLRRSGRKNRWRTRRSPGV